MISIEPSRLARLSPSRRRHGQTSDTQPRQHRIGRETQLVGSLDQEPDGNRHTGEAHAKSEELAIQACVVADAPIPRWFRREG
jgi:hypothetical protein